MDSDDDYEFEDEATPESGPVPGPVPGESPPPPPLKPVEESDSEPPPVGSRPPSQSDSQGFQVGIIGGKGSGKTYLFQAMVYRTASIHDAGALGFFLTKPSRLFKLEDGQRVRLATSKVIDPFINWIRLGFTTREDQQTYVLRLTCRSGLASFRPYEIDFAVMDASGEALQSESIKDLKTWNMAYGRAKVMIFCLPFWVAFPRKDLVPERDRAKAVMGFEQTFNNFLEVRDKVGRRGRVRTVLALTMADDKRCALPAVQEHWTNPMMEKSAQPKRREFRGERGLAEYLAAARKVSHVLSEQFRRSGDGLVGGIPSLIGLNYREPWIIPVSAIDGARLQKISEATESEAARLRADHPPVPAHVELPLLAALCDGVNALM